MATPLVCAEDMMPNEAGDMCVDIPEPMAMAEVTANGIGNLLKFGYWTTMMKDTLLAVTNLTDSQETITVKVMDGMGKPVGTITVCLGAYDTWTAAMTSSDESTSTLVGGNRGSCSAVMGGLSVKAGYGFIEVYPADMDMDMDSALMGIATVVNAEDGYASSYNATSLSVDDLASSTKGAAIIDALSMEGGISKDMLLGRWGALKVIGGMTQITLTFPVPGSAPKDPVSVMVYDEAGLPSVGDTAFIRLNNRVKFECTWWGWAPPGLPGRYGSGS